MGNDPNSFFILFFSLGGILFLSLNIFALIQKIYFTPRFKELFLKFFFLNIGYIVINIILCAALLYFQLMMAEANYSLGDVISKTLFALIALISALSAFIFFAYAVYWHGEVENSTDQLKLIWRDRIAIWILASYPILFSTAFSFLMGILFITVAVSS